MELLFLWFPFLFVFHALFSPLLDQASIAAIKAGNVDLVEVIATLRKGYRQDLLTECVIAATTAPNDGTDELLTDKLYRDAFKVRSLSLFIHSFLSFSLSPFRNIRLMPQLNLYSHAVMLRLGLVMIASLGD